MHIHMHSNYAFVLKIRRWEYVDMPELLPEFWGSPTSMRLDADGHSSANPTSTPTSRRRKVTDIKNKYSFVSA